MKREIDNENDRTYHKRGLECRNSGCKHLRVIYTRPTRGGRIMRGRECRFCGCRITTYEQEP